MTLFLNNLNIALEAIKAVAFRVLSPVLPTTLGSTDCSLTLSLEWCFCMLWPFQEFQKWSQVQCHLLLFLLSLQKELKSGSTLTLQSIVKRTCRLLSLNEQDLQTHRMISPTQLQLNKNDQNFLYLSFFPFLPHFLFPLLFLRKKGNFKHMEKEKQSRGRIPYLLKCFQLWIPSSRRLRYS